MKTEPLIKITVEGPSGSGKSLILDKVKRVLMDTEDEFFIRNVRNFGIELVESRRPDHAFNYFTFPVEPQ